ncbi:LuxR C-terminal-related transcriptional regulator [Nocardia sp. NPDC004278]
MAAWLGAAAVQFRGESAIAQGWFQRAWRLVADLPESEEHGLLELFEGMAARARGALIAASGHAERAMAIGHRLRSPDLELQAMALGGIIEVSRGRIAEGMRLLDEAAAAALAGEVREVASVWIPSCYLVQGCEQTRDWERAEQWCERVMDFCSQFDMGSPFAWCRTHYSTVLLWRGAWDEAETQLLQAISEFGAQQSRFIAEAWARLGELRRRQGRWIEAAELFERGKFTLAARIGRADLLLDQGDSVNALAAAQRVLGGLADDDRLGRCVGLEVCVRAAAAAGRSDLLEDAVGELTRISGDGAGDVVDATALWARGLGCAASGDHDQSDTLLSKSIELFQRTRGSYEAARVRLDLAAVLIAAGRRVAAAAEAQSAARVFDHLGAAADARRAGTLLAQAQQSADGELTGRQMQILRLLAVGLTNREIAERLVLSEHTVKRHVANILARLDLPSRAAAVGHASRMNML